MFNMPTILTTGKIVAKIIAIIAGMNANGSRKASFFISIVAKQKIKVQ
jgi:hypothetical protein